MSGWLLSAFPKQVLNPKTPNEEQVVPATGLCESLLKNCYKAKK